MTPILFHLNNLGSYYIAKVFLWNVLLSQKPRDSTYSA